MPLTDTFLSRHLLTTLAYRLQNTLRGAPADFASFELGFGVRTPQGLVRHINGALHYGLTVLQTDGAAYQVRQDVTWEEEIARFYELLARLETALTTHPPEPELGARILQGPLSDAMTHIGQLALLRRAAGSPVDAENFSAPI